jgi:RHS repeat-associated protein
MNAHHETTRNAFDLSGFHPERHGSADFFNALYDVWTNTWNYLKETTDRSTNDSSGTVIASGTYTYDSIDRRIGVDETSSGTTTQTWIVYKGNSNTPYAEFNGSRTLLERYLAGPSYVPGVTGMIARTNASGVTDWYLTGKLGSLRDIVNTSGTVIDHISYGAFGSIRAETNPSSGSQFKFDGMQYDTITGLYNDWLRNYDSTSGRFLTVDPTEFLNNKSNLYIFTQNSSTNILDLSGCNDINPYQPNPYFNPTTLPPLPAESPILMMPEPPFKPGSVQYQYWLAAMAKGQLEYCNGIKKKWHEEWINYETQVETMRRQMKFSIDQYVKITMEFTNQMQNKGETLTKDFALKAEINLGAIAKSAISAMVSAMGVNQTQDNLRFGYFVAREKMAHHLYNLATKQYYYWNLQASNMRMRAEMQQIQQENPQK